MAKHATETLAAGVWKLLSNSGDTVSSATFQVRRGGPVHIVGTTSESAPSDFDDAILYEDGQGERNASMSDLFPGISATRLYAYSHEAASVFISHA